MAKSGPGDSLYDSTEWKAVSFTHVEYPKGDLLGHVLAWISLSPLFMLISFITLIVFRRDLHTISYFSGFVFNEALNWGLKHYIKEERPVRGREVLFTHYGMPSSHSQFMWYFSSYLVLFMFVRVHHNTNKLDNLWKYAACLGAFSLSFAVSFSRVYLGYHTQDQIFWGAVVGALFGPLWFAAVHHLFTPYFSTIAGWPISEFLMLRDSTLIPGVLWFEYLSHRAEARTRLRSQRKALSRKSS